MQQQNVATNSETVCRVEAKRISCGLKYVKQILNLYISYICFSGFIQVKVIPFLHIDRHFSSYFVFFSSRYFLIQLWHAREFLHTKNLRLIPKEGSNFRFHMGVVVKVT